jgi:hypothetical protein
MTKKIMKNFTDIKSGYEASQFLFVGVTAINCVWQSIV